MTDKVNPILPNNDGNEHKPSFTVNSGIENNSRNYRDIPTKGHTSHTVIFFGPTSVGKSCALVRYAMYLKRNTDYMVSPNPHFKIDDPQYPNVIRKFDETISKGVLPRPNTLGDFMLLDVYKKGRLHDVKFQILEAPGEDYFNINDPELTDFPTYMTHVFTHQHNSKKNIYVFFLKANMFQEASNPNEILEKYQERVAKAIDFTAIGKNDRIITVLTAAENPSHGFIVNGRFNEKAFKNQFKANYTTLYDKVKRSKKRHWEVPFSAMSTTKGGNNTFTPSPDILVKPLADAIDAAVNGTSFLGSLFSYF